MLGNVRAFADPDKVFRRTHAGGYVGDIPVLNLPFALYHATAPDASTGSELKPLTDSQGRYIIRFHGPVGTYREYSIASVIMSGVSLTDGRDPIIPLHDFKDSFVLVGANAPALLDLRPSPFGAEYPGVLLNAAILDNILHRDFMRELPAIVSFVLAACVLSLVCYVAMYGSRLQWITLVLMYPAWVGVCFIAAGEGWWFPMITPLFAMFLATVACFGFQYTFEGRQHRFIKNAFQYYVTPEVIDKIIADPSMLSLGGERRELTIFFSDIAGFTTLSERMEPAKLVQFLNRFLSEMTDIILASGGTIDKYEGDAIIAFWNAPLSIPDHQLRAVMASLDCQRRLSELKSIFENDFGVQVQMRVGLNTGQVTVGNFGSSTRFNYTMIGDAANLASRLEGANKVFGSRILVSQMTREGASAPSIVWRKLGDIKVLGKSKPVSVFEPLDPKFHGKICKQLDVYNAAMASFEALDSERAKHFFSQIEDDAVSSAYLARISQADEVGGITTHIWNLTEK
jgi:adenylate cyclase